MTTLAEAIRSHPVPGICPHTPFPARVSGESVVIIAVLDRTAVFERGDTTDRQLARLDRIEVAEDALEWRVDEVKADRSWRAQNGRRAALASPGRRSRGARRG